MLINAMEIIIKGYFNEYKERFQMKCTCNKCMEDVFALTLNNIPPRYVSTKMGISYVKADLMDKQLQSNIITELAKSVIQINENPKHILSEE